MLQLPAKQLLLLHMNIFVMWSYNSILKSQNMENHRFCLPTHQYLTYRSITHFSIETAGHFDLDAELKKWVSGSPTPIERKFNKSEHLS